MEETKKRLEDWIRGEGQGAMGQAILQDCGGEKRRLLEKLKVPNLFEHIEHEDRMQLDKVEHFASQARRMIKRWQGRRRVIESLRPDRQDPQP